jgi:hypothetical protein
MVRPEQTRSSVVSINAPPERLFALINDLHGWDAWSPAKKDPAMKRPNAALHRGRRSV